ncbi:hypothetical protein FA396_26890, partial [Pseudomonas aeruginosa]|nr:hypothetical protein [Pseudomonas aeruginosa]
MPWLQSAVSIAAIGHTCVTMKRLCRICVVVLFGCFLAACDDGSKAVSYTHLRAHETRSNLVC